MRGFDRFRLDSTRPPVAGSAYAELGIVGLAATACAALLVRAFAWPAAETLDDWPYTVWAQGLIHGERPALDMVRTAPKPLAYLIGVTSLPIPADRAFTVAIALAAGVLTVAVFLAAFRLGGPAAAPVAVAVLMLEFGFTRNYQWADIDMASAALLVCAIAASGRWRVAMALVAGLVRPEAWAVALVAAYQTVGGSRLRRSVMAAGLGLLAPAAWALTDLALSGRPFVFLSVGAEAASISGVPQRSISELPHLMWATVSREAGSLTAIAGAIGLAGYAVRGLRRRELDPFIHLATAIWALGVAAEFHSRLPAYPRYTMPLAAVLAVGAGLVAGIVLPIGTGRASTWIALAAACAAVVAGTGLMARDPPQGMPPLRLLTESLPTVTRALACGRMGMLTASAAHPSRLIPMFAALADVPMRSFAVATPDTQDRYAAVLLQLGAGLRLRPTGVIRLPVGTLSLSPQCMRTIRAG